MNTTEFVLLWHTGREKKTNAVGSEFLKVKEEEVLIEMFEMRLPFGAGFGRASEICIKHKGRAV